MTRLLSTLILACACALAGCAGPDDGELAPPQHADGPGEAIGALPGSGGPDAGSGRVCTPDWDVWTAQLDDTCATIAGGDRCLVAAAYLCASFCSSDIEPISRYCARSYGDPSACAEAFYAGCLGLCVHRDCAGL